MNLPKFIQEDDERRFRLLLGDLFPSWELYLPVSEYGGVNQSAYYFLL
jgi:hypothetical protein